MIHENIVSNSNFTGEVKTKTKQKISNPIYHSRNITFVYILPDPLSSLTQLKNIYMSVNVFQQLLKLDAFGMLPCEWRFGYLTLKNCLIVLMSSNRIVYFEILLLIGSNFS